MNNQVQFACFRRCTPPDFVLQINNFFRLVLFSTVIHKGRGKMFLENYPFPRKSGNNTNSRGWRGHVLWVIMTQCVRKSISDSPLSMFRTQWCILFLNGLFVTLMFLLFYYFVMGWLAHLVSWFAKSDSRYEFETSGFQWQNTVIKT